MDAASQQAPGRSLYAPFNPLSLEAAQLITIVACEMWAEDKNTAISLLSEARAIFVVNGDLASALNCDSVLKSLVSFL